MRIMIAHAASSMCVRVRRGAVNIGGHDLHKGGDRTVALRCFTHACALQTVIYA